MSLLRDVSSQPLSAGSTLPIPGHGGLLANSLTAFKKLVQHLWPFEHSKMGHRILNIFLVGATIIGEVVTQCAMVNTSNVDLGWHAPNATGINDLRTVINGTGVYGFIFNSSVTPITSGYNQYNWCNMPHVRRQEYIVPPSEFKLEYAEVVCIAIDFLELKPANSS